MILTDAEIQEIRGVYERIIGDRMLRCAACLVWAGLTTSYLRKRGEFAILAAGSATFRGADPEQVPEPLPTHGSFQWTPNDPAWIAFFQARGLMPEFHAWCGVAVHDGAEGTEHWLVDLSAGHMKEYFKPIFDHAGVVWTVDTPDVVQVKCEDLAGTDLYGYVPYRDACMYATGKYLEAAKELGLPTWRTA